MRRALHLAVLMVIVVGIRVCGMDQSLERASSVGQRFAEVTGLRAAANGARAAATATADAAKALGKRMEDSGRETLRRTEEARATERDSLRALRSRMADLLDRWFGAAPEKAEPSQADSPNPDSED